MSGLDFLADRREAIAIAGATALVVSAPARAARPEKAPLLTGRNQPFDNDWRFHLGGGEGLEASGFDDSKWRSVDLPHDWSIEDLPDGIGPFNKMAIGGTATGFTEGGEGWYRKHYRLASVEIGGRAEILFDGIYGECDVWLNGERIGGHFHGYAPFALDLTPHLKAGGDNILAVRVRNLGKNSRWYSGSGLYRQVKLDVLPAAGRIARWGVGAWTRKIEGGSAQVDVTTKIESADPALTLLTRLRDAGGRVVAESSSSASTETKQTLRVRGPLLWSPDMPTLYSLETELRSGDIVRDRTTQPFGIRIVTMDTKRGLQINGKRVVLRGGCIHHDNGLLGACAYSDADERRVRLLKARGYNAIRSSHNPASKNLLDACDRLGMLVMNEAFDMWHIQKNPDDYHTHFAQDWETPLTAMVQSSRNHPSIIMWSIGNEIPSRSTPEGVEWEWKLANAIRRLDPTRPVTAALNGLLGPLVQASEATARPGKAGQADNAAAIFLDVAGYNYRLEDVERDFAAHPERTSLATETFPKDVYDYQALTARAPHFLGEFVWTAMDYLGEAGIGGAVPVKGKAPPITMGSWPWVNAYCGDIDLIGGQKAASRYRDVVWGISPLEIAVQRPVPDGMNEFVGNWAWSDEIQSWNWAGSEGKSLAVRVYTRGDKVELRLNGKGIAEKTLIPKDKMRTEFILPYAPDVLELVAYRGGKIIAQRRLETVSAPAKLLVAPERLEIRADRQTLAYVPIIVTDAKSRLIPDEKRKISITVTGPAELVGFGSANPQAVGSYQSHEAESFQGRALAILRSTGKAGTVRIEARAKGLTGAAATVTLTF
jgi:beta-galactosidase